METCKTCKFWGLEDNDYEKQGYKKCCKVKHNKTIMPDWNLEDDDIVELGILPAFLMDASNYKAQFHTREDFSCLLHQSN